MENVSFEYQSFLYLVQCSISLTTGYKKFLSAWDF